MALAKEISKPVIYGLLVPISVNPNMGSSQCEVVTRVVKEALNPELLTLFFRELLQAKAASSDPQWTDLIINILQTILNAKIQPDDELVGIFANELDRQSDVPHLATSLKFTNLAFTLVKKHETEVRPHAELLKKMISKCKSFIVKPTLEALNKMS
eukprot:TRINITY_DN4634_c0_g1_i1.p1 TRINITY_DN4634_c0_g1~~TRINITY_DN4634_c0_g1_i1.p1  ORF type:complete len:156 (-),score=34.06 TRINITY_DN4634_c0_g1_i1:64-531(-)